MAIALKRPPITPQQFAAVLKTIRERLDITQEELAERMGVSQQAINVWETAGLKKGPSRGTLKTLAEVAPALVAELLGKFPGALEAARGGAQGMEMLIAATPSMDEFDLVDSPEDDELHQFLRQRARQRETRINNVRRAMALMDDDEIAQVYQYVTNLVRKNL